jgi:predicted GTPase
VSLNSEKEYREFA